MKEYFECALSQAKDAFDLDLVPVGAVLVYKGEIIAKNHNGVSPLAHAEMLVLEEGLKKLSHNIKDAVLYVTLEPCAMCLAAFSLCGLKRIYFGAYNDKSIINPHVELYGGFYEKECSVLLKEFFIIKREA